MSVKELIAVLERMPMDAVIVVEDRTARDHERNPVEGAVIDDCMATRGHVFRGSRVQFTDESCSIFVPHGRRGLAGHDEKFVAVLLSRAG